ncbi:MAG: ATP-dependent sacrificial sulfur transferase LarE [Thermoprotei archaeon]|nr:MAG: ATP-dependent sacrificial sulfur transferase LarE [Thermoprotei archaeon]
MSSIVDIEEKLDKELRTKFRNLINWYKSVNGPVLVAFSGGVDSSVALAVAVLVLGSSNVIAVTAISPTYPEEDLEWARKITKLLGVKHAIIKTNELEDPNFVSNPPIRCYFCKKSLVNHLLKLAKEYKAKVIIDGTNASDLKTHRPGYLALKEAGIRTPLAEVDLTKRDIRLLAKALGLPNWDKPSMACLASRIPYGEIITLEKLKRIANAEKIVKRITGVKQLRVRDHGYIARIEVGRDERRKFFNEEVMDRVAQELIKLGYKFVTLDLLGYRQGSLDTLISDKKNSTTLNTQ